MELNFFDTNPVVLIIFYLKTFLILQNLNKLSLNSR